MATRKKEDEPKSFEDAMQRLDAIVAKLEEDKLPLEEMLASYEEGVALARRADPEDLPATGIGRRNEPVRAVTRTEPRAAEAAQRLERQVRDVDVQDHSAIERRHQQPLYDEAGDPRRSGEIGLARHGPPQRERDRRQTEEATLDGGGDRT